MNDTKTLPEVEVTQADREAAAAYERSFNNNYSASQIEIGLREHHHVLVTLARHRITTAQASDAEIARLREALVWYGEQARLCRLIHREGDAGRQALDADGGKRARAALAAAPDGPAHGDVQ